MKVDSAALLSLAREFMGRAHEAATEATRCANQGDGSGLLAREYERTTWLRAARELRELANPD